MDILVATQRQRGGESRDEEAGAGGVSKTGDEGGAGEGLRVAGEGESPGEDLSDKGGGMGEELIGEGSVLMMRLGDKVVAGAGSTRGSGSTGQGDQV